MATMALPIQELNADIQVDAAVAQKHIVRLQPKQRLNPFAWLQTLAVAYYCSRVIEAEERLVGKLQDADFNHCDRATLEELATDLDRLVSLTMAVVDKGDELPNNSFKNKFGKLVQLANHIDSFAESLHMAADPHCEGMLALAVAEHSLSRTAV